MRKKVLHTIVVTLVLAATVCAQCPGSPLPVPLPPCANLKVVVSTRGTPMPTPIPLIASSAQRETYPGSPLPVPLPPIVLRG